ncbi:Neurotransmitter-gated ion-channel transmembrane region [Necator americanus]|uniref:Neurotransmitter-gated ion-channel transmembrane region n=1 Tax=Necator americanus TaxID=51031 RepID=W2TW48_NECAM|nr:Neurotransmitter-gated ion-channel transmembrane region [Necator americanus]ETN86285.1 Neurotransmitter-gated ion-channel transmembrane region [Necator americanus]
MMVFCSLLEYAAVGYITKRMKLREKKRESRVVGLSPSEPPPSRTVSVPAYFNRGYRPFYSSTDTNSNLYIPESQRVPLTLQEMDCHCPLPPQEEQRLSRISAVSSIVALKPARRTWPSWSCLRPSNIDKISRWSFPTYAAALRCNRYSDGYTTADIDYFWGRQKSDLRQGAVAFDKFMLPQFKQTGYNVNITKAVTSSGEYVRLYFEVLLVRNMGFYSMNIVIPSMLIVTISWVSFWLNREASPARVGLGVTTVLTMTTLITTTNVSVYGSFNSMPKVSYIKGLDVFLNFCFVMVFASLVEYAVVSYMNKRIALRREKRRRQAEQQQRTEVPMFSNTLSPKQPNNNMYEMSLISQNSTPAKSFAQHVSGSHQLMEIPVDCDCRTIPLIQHPRLVADGAHTMWPAPFGKPKKASKTCRNVTPAKIDKCSRYIFPLLFSGFNGELIQISLQISTNSISLILILLVVYWTIMTVLSSMSENLSKDEWIPIPTED